MTPKVLYLCLKCAEAFQSSYLLTDLKIPEPETRNRKCENCGKPRVGALYLLRKGVNA